MLKQEVGLGHAEGEPSYQLALHQGQAGKLGVVDEALSAEDSVINAATWKNTGSAGRHERLSPLSSENNDQDPNACSVALLHLPALPESGSHACPAQFPLSRGLLPSLPS